MMKWIAIIVGILGILLTVKPFIRNANWIIRLGDFPRLQILALFSISLLVYIFYSDSTSFFDYGFIIVVIICAIYQIYCIAPFTPFYPKEVQNSENKEDSETSFSLLIFNVLMENESYQEVCEFIKEVNADIVLLAEPNKDWDSNLTEVKKIYKYKVSHILENHYGMMLFSNLELNETEVQFLIQDDIPSIHTKIKLRSGDEIAFHGVHPRPPVPEEKGRSIERDGELLLVGKAIRESNLPCVVAGDLNDVAWSASTQLFKKISGLLDPRIGRGFFNTFHAQKRLIRMPLDHIFHSHHFRLIEIKVIKDSYGSDHFPVFIELNYEKDAAVKQLKPTADNDEKQEAEELVQVALKENKLKRLSFKGIREKVKQLKQRIVKKK